MATSFIPPQFVSSFFKFYKQYLIKIQIVFLNELEIYVNSSRK